MVNHIIFGNHIYRIGEELSHSHRIVGGVHLAWSEESVSQKWQIQPLQMFELGSKLGSHSVSNKQDWDRDKERLDGPNPRL